MAENSRLTRGGVELVLYLSLKILFIIHDTETIITETYLDFNIIDPVVFSCVSKVQLHQTPSPCYRKKTSSPQKNTIKIKSSPVTVDLDF